MPFGETTLNARLGIKGTLEFRDKDGVILKTADLSGSVPLEELGLTLAQAQELINQQEVANGDDDH